MLIKEWNGVDEMNNLSYNGQSLNEKGFAIKTYPKYKIAERDIEFESIIGLSGDVITDKQRFRNVEMTYEINSIPYLIDFEDPQDVIRDLANWLISDGKYKILRDDYNKGYFCKAVCTSIGEISNVLSQYIDTVLTFSRQPFWYSDKGQEKISFTNEKSTFEILNPEMFKSEPLIRIYGKSSLKLTINGSLYDITIPASVKYIDLDTELQSAFSGGLNCNKYVDFDYMPTFIPGKNIISIAKGTSSEASFEKMEITPRWRRL